MLTVDEWTLLATLALAVAIVWVALQIRKLHADLQPLLESRVVRAVAEA